MMYQFLGIKLRLPYGPLQRFEAEGHKPVNAPQVKSEEDNREQHDDRCVPYFGASRPRGLGHLELDRVIKLANARRKRELGNFEARFAALIAAPSKRLLL